MLKKNQEFILLVYPIVVVFSSNKFIPYGEHIIINLIKSYQLFSPSAILKILIINIKNKF